MIVLLLLLRAVDTQKADAAFTDARFKKAAQLYMRALAKAEKGSDDEKRVRERIVLAYYNAGDKTAAREAYELLLRKFPEFRFDAQEVMPETIAFFVPPPEEKPATATATSTTTEKTAEPETLVVAPAETPREVTMVASAPVVEKPKWSPAYLAPFGIGQFIARSPVRGVLFLTLEVALLATNISTAIVFARDRQPNGKYAHADASKTLQIVMDVSFFATIATFIAAALDGGLGEP